MPKIVDKEAKKQEILEAALKVFAKKGVSETKIHEIAEAAGVAKGTIYLYFKNKEEMFQSILEHHGSMMASSLAPILSGGQDPQSKLIQLVATSLENAKHNDPEIILDIWASMVRNPQKKDLGDSLVHFRDMISQTLEDGIQQGIFRSVDTKAVASGLIAMLHGFSLLEMVDEKRFSMVEVASTMVEILLVGIKT